MPELGEILVQSVLVSEQSQREGRKGDVPSLQKSETFRALDDPTALCGADICSVLNAEEISQAVAAAGHGDHGSWAEELQILCAELLLVIAHGTVKSAQVPYIQPLGYEDGGELHGGKIHQQTEAFLLGDAGSLSDRGNLFIGRTFLSQFCTLRHGSQSVVGNSMSRGELSGATNAFHWAFDYELWEHTLERAK